MAWFCDSEGSSIDSRPLSLDLESCDTGGAAAASTTAAILGEGYGSSYGMADGGASIAPALSASLSARIKYRLAEEGACIDAERLDSPRRC